MYIMCIICVYNVHSAGCAVSGHRSTMASDSFPPLAPTLGVDVDYSSGGLTNVAFATRGKTYQKSTSEVVVTKKN